MSGSNNNDPSIRFSNFGRIVALPSGYILTGFLFNALLGSPLETFGPQERNEGPSDLAVVRAEIRAQTRYFDLKLNQLAEELERQRIEINRMNSNGTMIGNTDHERRLQRLEEK